MFRIILCLLFYCIVIFIEVLIIVCVLYVLCYCTNPAFGCYILINFFFESVSKSVIHSVIKSYLGAVETQFRNTAIKTVWTIAVRFCPRLDMD